MAPVKIYAVEIQLKRIALTASSFAMVGSAIIKEVPINGVKNEAMVAISKTVVLSTFLPLDICVSMFAHPNYNLYVLKTPEPKKI
jgi:hypothetical protein